ncbi:MAG: NAD(P)/FAD-dependent oxidoreductase [Rhodospirillales bacterium]|nr:NAD(P)/FAD-dependent oxidoreductase [Rhodospirillales bacterium]
MNRDARQPANHFDAIVVGGGHNGLVTAAYLARSGLAVAVLEARDRLGGPCGSFNFIPGYRVGFSNSPGSLEPRVVQELDLPGFGLRFARPEATVVHAFPDHTFVGWRDQARVDEQFDAGCPGEAQRYHALMRALEDIARRVGVSVFEPPPSLAEIERRLISPAEKRMFQRAFVGSIRDLLEESLKSEKAKTILCMIGIATNMAPPSAPGTAIGLMLRPLSLASQSMSAAHDPHGVPLRGSTGLPIGGMGAIVDALEACCRSHGVVLRTQARTARILHRDGTVQGAVTETGEEFLAPVVVSSVNPRLLFRDLLDERAVDADVRKSVIAQPMQGSAFKMVLALDGIPRYANLPAGVETEQVAGTQFRIGPSLDYIEAAVLDGINGRPSKGPIMWGLTPSVTSPGMAPEGRHIMSVNIWHAPYWLRDADWATETDRFGRHCIDVLSDLMPDLKDRIVDHRFMGPDAIEAELNLVESNITHGDMLSQRLFGARPHVLANDYRTPLQGLYLTGAGTWPGGYVTGVPGRNTSQAVLADLRRDVALR